MALVLGQLAYISGLPIGYAFEHGLLGDEAFELVTGHPDELDSLMAAGKLVAGPVSSLEYIRHGDRYSLIKDLSIGAWGRIGSSLLISKREFNQLDGTTVALPRHGTTSNALTRWLLEKMFGAHPTYVEAEGTLDELLAHHEAVLLIGDQAVVEGRTHPELHRLDMGQAWWQAMHTPFVHTVWVCQAGLPRPERERIAKLYQQAKELGKDHAAEIVAEASRKLGVPAQEIEAYFALLNFDLTPAHMQGLGLFADYLDETIPQEAL